MIDMSPSMTTCSLDENILRIAVDGIPSVKDYVAYLSECYGKALFKHALWDFKRSSLSGMSADGFKVILSAGARFSEKRGEGAKTAIVVANSSEITLLEAFGLHAGLLTPVMFRGFLCEGDAIVWLKE